VKPAYIKYLIESVFEIFSENFNLPPKKEKVSFDAHGLKADVVATIGLIGDLEGSIILLTDNKTALNIASKMFQDDIKELDDLSLSSISELLNFIAGRMITKLYQLKYDNDITPPTIAVKRVVELDYANSIGVRILLESDMGKLEFALTKNKK